MKEIEEKRTMKQNRRKNYKFTATTTVDVVLSLFYFVTNKRQKNEEDREYNIKSNTTSYIIFQHNKEQITAIYIHNEREKRKI